MFKKSIVIVLFSLFSFSATAQQKEIRISELPDEVKNTLNEYITILSTSNDIDECAVKFLEIAGGGLVNPKGNMLRNSVKPYSLTKDFQNIKFYKVPVEIIRVVKTKTNQAGYGQSALAGDWYKIYRVSYKSWGLMLF